jgi:hypothetical protein
MIEEKPSEGSVFGRSIRLWILVVALVYFTISLYWAYMAWTWGPGEIADPYINQMLSKGPSWWFVLFYTSEAFAGMIGLPLRALAGAFAVIAAVTFYRQKENAFIKIRRKIGVWLALEAVFFLALTFSTIAAFAYNVSSEDLWYFDGIPKLVLLFVTALPCLAIITVVVPALLKLRSKVVHAFPKEDIIKWSCIVGVVYLFVVFWFSYTMTWIANMVPPAYWRPSGLYGLSFLAIPINLASFILTVGGLLLLAVFGLVTALPGIKKMPEKLSPKRIGATIAGLGAYFVVILVLYFAAGGFEKYPTPWYEIIGPLHNPDLWCVSLLLLGIAVIAVSRKGKKPQQKTQ